MSRIGKQPVPLPDGVKVTVSTEKIQCEGAKGKLEAPLFPGITVDVEETQIVVKRESDEGNLPAFHGLARSLVANAVIGVSSGFEKKLEIVGVGYRAKLEKDKLELNLGYSKPVIYEIPGDIQVVLEKPTLITIKGIDKQRVGQEAHKIRSFRKPDPYKLKGIRYAGERLHKKERKAGVGGV
jgi:large subunit ribosomal protein L6